MSSIKDNRQTGKQGRYRTPIGLSIAISKHTRCSAASTKGENNLLTCGHCGDSILVSDPSPGFIVKPAKSSSLSPAKFTNRYRVRSELLKMPSITLPHPIRQIQIQCHRIYLLIWVWVWVWVRSRSRAGVVVSVKSIKAFKWKFCRSQHAYPCHWNWNWGTGLGLGCVHHHRSHLHPSFNYFEW